MGRFQKCLMGLRRRLRYVLWRCMGFFFNSATVRTKQGLFRIHLNGKDHISERLFTHREFELDFMRSSMSLLRSANLHPPKGQGLVLDVGANIGVISIGMLATGEVRSAVAIEPDPKSFLMLNKNIQLNGLEHDIVALNWAATDNTSVLEFELAGGNYGDNRVRCGTGGNAPELFFESNRRTLTLQGRRLDDLPHFLSKEVWNKISVLWIDIQGHEGFAFRGAEGLLSKQIPVVTEFWPYGVLRSGMSKGEFCTLASDHWSRYWVQREEVFRMYPISGLHQLFDKYSDNGGFENIILGK